MFQADADKKIFRIIPNNMLIGFEKVHDVYTQNNCPEICIIKYPEFVAHYYLGGCCRLWEMVPFLE